MPRFFEASGNCGTIESLTTFVSGITSRSHKEHAEEATASRTLPYAKEHKANGCSKL